MLKIKFMFQNPADVFWIDELIEKFERLAEDMRKCSSIHNQKLAIDIDKVVIEWRGRK